MPFFVYARVLHKNKLHRTIIQFIIEHKSYKSLPVIGSTIHWKTTMLYNYDAFERKLDEFKIRGQLLCRKFHKLCTYSMYCKHSSDTFKTSKKLCGAFEIIRHTLTAIWTRSLFFDYFWKHSFCIASIYLGWNKYFDVWEHGRFRQIRRREDEDGGKR